MEFELYESVRIKGKNIPGTIIDTCIGRYDGKLYYIVESNIQGYTDDPDAYQGEWPIYDCTADQLEKL